jgi:aerobic-type carbon monoxide dehydrogenase small subunit (CoxS/CutS family)
VLRDRICLTGTSFDCGPGQCGACVVLEGERGTTIEAPGTPSDPHPLQRTFLEIESGSGQSSLRT